MVSNLVIATVPKPKTIVALIPLPTNLSKSSDPSDNSTFSPSPSPLIKTLVSTFGSFKESMIFTLTTSGSFVTDLMAELGLLFEFSDNLDWAKGWDEESEKVIGDLLWVLESVVGLVGRERKWEGMALFRVAIGVDREIGTKIERERD